MQKGALHRSSFLLYHYFISYVHFFLLVQTPQAKEKSEPKKENSAWIISWYLRFNQNSSFSELRKNGYKAIAYALPFFPSDKQSNVLWNFD